MDQGCHFRKSGLPLCTESARRAERAREAGLESPAGRQLRFRVATSMFQGWHFVQNQPEGLNGPAKRAPKRLQGYIKVQGCYFHVSGLPLCAESAQRAERAREAGLESAEGRQVRNPAIQGSQNFPGIAGFPASK